MKLQESFIDLRYRSESTCLAVGVRKYTEYCVDIVSDLDHARSHFEASIQKRGIKNNLFTRCP